MDTSELIKKVRKIEIKTKGLSAHLFAGEYHSAFKGTGMSFSEVRAYSYGDDVRNIDWNVTARAQETFVKVFEEERELTVMLLIDVSASQEFGTQGVTKKDYMTEIAAVLAFSALGNNDKVGAILFSDKIEAYLPPKKGKKNILRLIRELIVVKPQSKGTNIAVVLDFFNSVQKKKCISFLISDFQSPDFQKPLGITARKHDLIGIKINDKQESALQDMGMLSCIDPESGQQFMIDTSSKSFTKKYKEYFDSSNQYFLSSFTKLGAESIAINTQDDYIKALIDIFKKR
jgi:uncharacterized protein (DUF58 family)